MPKAACLPLHGLGGPGWVEEKWVSSVAMVTATAPCQPAHLNTNLTDELLCPACWDGGQESEIGGWSVYGCVCVCVFQLVQAPAQRWCVCVGQGNSGTQVRHFPVPWPLKRWGSSCLSGLDRAKGEVCV